MSQSKHLQEIDRILSPSRKAKFGDLRGASLSQPTPEKLGGAVGRLAPSPQISSDSTGCSNADPDAIPSTPQRSTRRSALSLAVPDFHSEENASLTQALNQVPISPRTDSGTTYGSPTSVLPRRSRGLDFSRASTHLHHSTIMEQSSPESSPVLASRPSSFHKRISAGGIEPTIQQWQMMTGLERGVGGGAVSSPSTTSSSGDEPETNDNSDRDDPMLLTPQANRIEPGFASPGNEFLRNFRGATSSLMGYRRSTRRSRRPPITHHPSSVSANIAMSPIASGMLRDGPTRASVFKRATSSLSTIDSNNPATPDSEDSNAERPSRSAHLDGFTDPGIAVIQRPVSRRGNMLPKSRGFARIRATLIEESAPIESESKRESEVIRQVKEREEPPVKPQPTNPESEPVQGVSNVDHSDEVSKVIDDCMTTDSPTAVESRSRSSSFLLSRPSFSSQAKRLSGGKEFWHMMERTHTPPPLLRQRDSSTGTDMMMDSPAASTPSSMSLVNATPNTDLAQAADSYSTLPNGRQGGPSMAEISRMVNGKRKRDDSDLDVASIKRRAVSPSLSAQQSPILGSAPFGRPERQNSAGMLGQGTKKVGLAGMTDTNDAIMKMSIG